MDDLGICTWASDFGHLSSIGRLGYLFDLVVKADLGICRPSSFESELVWRVFDVAGKHESVAGRGF